MPYNCEDEGEPEGEETEPLTLHVSSASTSPTVGSHTSAENAPAAVASESSR